MIEAHSDVAKIWCHRAGEVPFGSGLLVARNLVLTARHVIATAGGSAELRVRLMRHDGMGQDALPAGIAWMSERADLALLKIEQGDHQPRSSYRFCSLQHARPISSVSVTGFPLATRDELDRAKDYTVEGNLRREGPGKISFSVAPPDQPARRTGWQGMSGAAAYLPGKGRVRDVFGVIEEERSEFPNGKLFLAPAEFLNDAGFAEAYRAASGEEPVFVELRDTLRSRASDRFPFLDRLYEDLGGLPGGSKSPHVFEIGAARVATFEETKAVISGGSETSERLSPRLLLPSTGTGYERLLLYLQAPGGYGKTSFLRRLIRSAIDEGFVVFYLDPEGTPDWSSLELLFRTSTTSGGNFRLFEAAQEQEWLVLLVIDGLNESTAEWPTIQSRLQELESNYGGVSIIAGDRMNPDRTAPREFGRATLLPVEVARIPDDRLRELVGRSTANRLLSVPFFLDKYYAMRETEGRPDLSDFGRADIISAYLQEYAGAGSAEGEDGLIGRLSKLAFEAYHHKTLQIEDKAIDGTLSTTERDRLTEAGVILGHKLAQGGKAYSFSHQLIHDFLAAKWLEKGGSKAWMRDNFDAVTLEARSFDALELASELLGARADEFIVEVYDWNYKAALECILNLDAGLSGKPSPLPPALKDAVFTLRAEKLFDRFKSTRVSARGRLETFKAASAIDFAAMRSPEELIEAIRSNYDPGDETGLYRDWKDLFTVEHVSVRHWSLIQDLPLLGWTAANVFRRPGMLSDELTAHLVSLYRALLRSQPDSDRGITTRWRIVHALGGASTEEVAKTLSSAVLDEKEDEWVRYGAVRSLVEIASRMPDLESARALLEPLVDASSKLPEKVRREVRDVAMLAENVPSWWPPLYGEVLRTAMSRLNLDDPEEAREHSLWQARLNDLAAPAANEA